MREKRARRAPAVYTPVAGSPSPRPSPLTKPVNAGYMERGCVSGRVGATERPNERERPTPIRWTERVGGQRTNGRTVVSGGGAGRRGRATAAARASRGGRAAAAAAKDTQLKSDVKWDGILRRWWRRGGAVRARGTYRVIAATNDREDPAAVNKCASKKRKIVRHDQSAGLGVERGHRRILKAPGIYVFFLRFVISSCYPVKYAINASGPKCRTKASGIVCVF